MPDTVMFPPAVVVGEPDDYPLAVALVREVAAGHRPRVILDQPLPIAACSVVETLADSLDELDRDLVRLRRRRGAPPSIGGRIRQAAAEAELLGSYAHDLAESLKALRSAGAGVVIGKIGERSRPACADDERVNLRLLW
ncbi:hypothetical protein [Azospirillum thiophilum]|uniref:hypothetical protein n=1 Tax=Azospirillum thiophilum TaxID=528244 RepID=UPI00118752EC|nr:hypothetical protein [Azospirillum thiophilum]